MLATLAKAVRDGEIDPLDLVEESLRRIEASAGTLNSVVAVRAEEARREAAEPTRQGALAGLPLLVKDMARCAGMRTTFGSRQFADAPVDEVDDVVVARMRAAGAIVVGRTNTPEFGHTAITANGLFGVTTNPWNLERSPGGSSGGSAAALSAGLAPLATTSDGGGSVRIPASCCGLVGYKPTMGAIGRNVTPRWMTFSTMGVTGRSVADVVLEASVTLGPAPGDLLTLPRSAVQFEPTRPLRVLTCRTFRRDVDDVIEAAQHDALEHLVAEGFEVVAVDAPFEPDDIVAWFTISSAELAQSLLDSRDRWDELDASLQGVVGYGEAVTAADYIAAQRLRFDRAARVDALLGDDAVLVVPTVNVTSWPAAGPLPSSAGRTTGDLSIATNTADLNLTGHPAVSVPLGSDDAGVPFGLQVVAPRFADGLALGVAQVLETRRPWPLVAPGFTPFPTGPA